MGEHVGAARTAFEVPQSVILAGVGFDHLEAGAVAFRTDVFHEEKK